MIEMHAWKWMDNDKKKKKFLIPKSLYLKGWKVNIQSLQHWDQNQMDEILS